MYRYTHTETMVIKDCPFKRASSKTRKGEYFSTRKFFAMPSNFPSRQIKCSRCESMFGDEQNISAGKMAANKCGCTFPFPLANTVAQSFSFPRNNRLTWIPSAIDDERERASRKSTRECETRKNVVPTGQAWMLDTSFFQVPCPSQSPDDDLAQFVDATGVDGLDT